MKKFLLAATALAAVAGLSTPAHAVLQVAADFGGTVFLCVDNAACDTNLSTGTIQIANQNIGGIQVNGSIQTSSGTPANPGPTDVLNTSSLSLINVLGVPVAYNVVISDTSFTSPTTTFASSTAGTWQSAIGSNSLTRWYADVANTQGADAVGDAPGVLLDTFSSTALVAADSYSHNGSGAFISAAPFSLTEQITGTLTGNAQLINRGQTILLDVTPTPEPASLTLLGLGLIGLGFARRMFA